MESVVERSSGPLCNNGQPQNNDTISEEDDDDDLEDGSITLQKATNYGISNVDGG
jgi:hypothetical protein